MKFFIWIPLCAFFVFGASGVGSDEVSVKEGDSITLHTGVTTNQQEKIKWYFNNTRIAQINRDLRVICTDVQCNEGTERFRDRLKLDHQTGSLTITNIRNTDSGVYRLQIISSSGKSNEKSFSLNVTDISAAEREKLKRKSVKEGESVTLDPAVMKNKNDSMTWHYNGVLIAEITGDQSQICADDQCKERFRDRLKLDHQTGTLTITNTRTSDSGEYKLQITSSGISIRRRRRRNISITTVTSFSVSVTAVPGSGLSSAAVAGIVVGVLLVFVALAAAVIYYRRCRRRAPVPQNDDDAP